MRRISILSPYTRAALRSTATKEDLGGSVLALLAAFEVKMLGILIGGSGILESKPVQPPSVVL